MAWYNGHPHYADHAFDLNGGRAVVVGNGNVAIDVARMLVLDPTELAPTDTADHALEAFGMAGVTEVVLLGRRGPAEAAFTNPELRELGELERADVIVDPAQLEGVEVPEDAEATKRRNVEILRDYSQRTPSGKSHRLELRFLRSPLEILGEGEDGPVTGVRVAINRLVAGEDGRVRAEPTGETEDIECGLVLRSIGYRGTPLAGIPFDERRGLIRNEEGRVVTDDGVCRGEYVVGWIKRGPTGVIGTNKKDAADTVARILEDAEAGALSRPDPALADGDAVAAWLTERVPDHVTWSGWEMIDAYESPSWASRWGARGSSWCTWPSCWRRAGARAELVAPALGAETQHGDRLARAPDALALVGEPNRRGDSQRGRVGRSDPGQDARRADARKGFVAHGSGALAGQSPAPGARGQPPADLVGVGVHTAARAGEVERDESDGRSVLASHSPAESVLGPVGDDVLGHAADASVAPGGPIADVAHHRRGAGEVAQQLDVGRPPRVEREAVGAQ